MMNVKSFKSAIIIAPPLDQCQQIQEFRKAHDKAYPRWMPHINLVYPFYQEHSQVFEREALKLTKHLTNIKPFRVTFNKDSIGMFRHGYSKCTIWIRPLMTKLPPKPEPCPKKKVKPAKPAEPVKPAKPVKEMTLQKAENIVLAPMSMPMPKLPVRIVQEVQHTLIGHPEPIPISTTKYTPPSGLDALRDAIWTPENTEREIQVVKSMHEVDSFAALRFAFWTTADNGLEQASYKESTLGENRYMTFNKVLSDVTPIQLDAMNTCTLTSIVGKDDYNSGGTEWKLDFSGSVPYCPSGHSVSPEQKVDLASTNESSDSDSEDVAEPMAEMEDDALVMLPDGQHPGVMALQEELAQVYPDLDDLSSQSELGFQPHLTLGQSNFHGASLLMAEFKSSFKEISFMVDKIQIIGRGSFNESFKVKMSVPIGATLEEW